MPFPPNMNQGRVVVNGQPARRLGRDPKVVKPWKHIDKPQIDQRTFKVIPPKEPESE